MTATLVGAGPLALLSGSGSLTPALPAAAQAGDRLYLVCHGANVTPAIVAPDGWTEEGQRADAPGFTQYRVAVFSADYAAGAPTVTLPAIGSPDRFAAFVVAVRGGGAVADILLPAQGDTGTPSPSTPWTPAASGLGLFSVGAPLAGFPVDEVYGLTLDTANGWASVVDGAAYGASSPFFAAVAAATRSLVVGVEVNTPTYSRVNPNGWTHVALVIADATPPPDPEPEPEPEPEPQGATLLTYTRYVQMTGDTATPSARVEVAIRDAESSVAEYLRRPLVAAERTEVVCVDVDGLVYPRATPILAAPYPIADPVTLANVPRTTTTLTYTGGWTSDTAPVTLLRLIARIAAGLILDTTPPERPAGAVFVETGDVTTHYDEPGSAGDVTGRYDLDALAPGSEWQLRRWRYVD